jgi:cell wall-associated NlpC family hydrolase
MRRLFIVLLAAGATACATTGATPQPFPVPNGPTVSTPASSIPRPESEAPVPPAPPPADGYEISGAALAFRGAPYRNGGTDPSGFDCSGFVWYIFDQYGVRLPRTVSDQFRSGTEVDPKDLRAGDLVFFDTIFKGGVRQLATHVGIVIGGDEFVHAPSSTGEVRVERLGSSYWGPRFVGARRVQ